MNLTGKTALVTGAGQGIGKAIALALVSAGAKVALLDINQNAIDDLSQKINSNGGEALAVYADVTDISSIAKIYSSIENTLGNVDILVNNAGILHATEIEDITEKEWDTQLAVNLKSTFFYSQAALPSMKKKKWGRIINLSSLAGRMGGYTNGVAYSAAKAGIIGLTKALANRLAADNITVNAIAPGPTETNILSTLSKDKLDKLIKDIPLKKLGLPKHIGELTVFLASEAADYITGTVLDVNGGLYMG